MRTSVGYPGVGCGSPHENSAKIELPRLNPLYAAVSAAPGGVNPGLKDILANLANDAPQTVAPVPYLGPENNARRFARGLGPLPPSPIRSSEARRAARRLSAKREPDQYKQI